MTRIHFAPLQGYTEAGYRNSHEVIFGSVDTYYTSFVRLEKGDFRKKDLRDIDPEKSSVSHLIPQLVASSPEEFKKITELFLEKGYKEININMGCPFPPIVKKQKGAGILPHPEMVRKVLEEIDRYPGIRFSIKMRLGWDSPQESLNLLPLLNELPLQHIIMHPRLGRQQYAGDIDMEGFSAFYANCHHPVMYNGDIRKPEDIDRITALYPKLSGVMVGRGLLANPALAMEYKNKEALPAHDKVKRIQQLHSDVFRNYQDYLDGGEAQLLNKMKVFWEYLLPDSDRKIKKSIQKSSRLSAYEKAVQELLRSVE